MNKPVDESETKTETQTVPSQQPASSAPARRRIAIAAAVALTALAATVVAEPVWRTERLGDGPWALIGPVRVSLSQDESVDRAGRPLDPITPVFQPASTQTSACPAWPARGDDPKGAARSDVSARLYLASTADTPAPLVLALGEEGESFSGGGEYPGTPPVVRLGDVYQPPDSAGYAVAPHHLCLAVADPRVGFDAARSTEQSVGSPVYEAALDPEILAGALANLLLTADAMQVRHLTIFDQPIVSSGAIAPAELLAAALRDAVDIAGAHLRAPVSIALEATPQAPIAGALVERSLWVRLGDLLGRAVQTPLPWRQRADALTARQAPETVALADGTIDARALNPVFTAPPRASALPALLFAVAFLGLLAHRMRRRPPERTLAWWLSIYAALIPLPVLLLYLLRQQWTWWPDAPVGLPDPAAGLWSILPLVVLAGAMAAAGGFAGVWADRIGRAPLRRAETGPAQAATQLRSTLHRDTPVENVAQDRLGFAPLVGALVRFLDNRDTLPPVVLSINGPWGSGKSSIMKMLCSELEKTKRFRTAWFNAWQYHDQDKILAAFLRKVSGDMTKDVGLLFWPRLAWGRLREASVPKLLLLGLLPLLVILALARPGSVPLLGDAFAEVAKEGGGGWLDAAAGILSLGWLATLLRYLQPFRAQFGTLVAMRDYGKELGALNEFERDFRHYREAVDREKFLICIDDLDRCPPDKVVDVLKTINLIITGQEGAGRTFFVLGFDPRYIVRSVELHFEKLAAASDLVGGRFGQQYVKKMVTLSVSVPTASPDKLRDLVTRLEEAAERAQAGEAAAGSFGQRLRRFLDANWRWLAALALLAAIGVAVLLLVPGTEEKAGSGDAAGSGQGGTVMAEPPPLPEGPTQAARLPTPSRPAATAPWLTWAAAALLLAALGLAGLRAWRWMRERIAIPPEPKDPPALSAAIEALSALLPENPRDTIRLVNAIRATYLLQAEGVGASPGAPALSAQDCVLYTLLQHHVPEFFDPESFEIMAAVGRVAEQVSGRTKPPESVPQSSDIGRLVEGLNPEARAAIHAYDKIQRFIDLNRHLLDATSTSPAGAAAAH